MDEVYDIASDVKVENGNVAVAGPGGVGVLVTPNAAPATSDRLLEGATESNGRRFRGAEAETERLSSSD